MISWRGSRRTGSRPDSGGSQSLRTTITVRTGSGIGNVGRTRHCGAEAQPRIPRDWSMLLLQYTPGERSHLL